jgi:hypothetical protein
VRHHSQHAGADSPSNPEGDVPGPTLEAAQTQWQDFVGSLSGTVVNGSDVPEILHESSRKAESRKTFSYDQQVASQSLATFPLRNASDAIRLLDQDPNSTRSEQPGETVRASANVCLPQFFLLQEGLIDEAQIFRLFSFYLKSIHPIMPLIPHERKPTTSERILTMAGREPHFMAAILVVTTSLLGDHSLHRLLWQRVERLFAQVAIKGTNDSLEMLEGLLLLSGMRFKTGRQWQADSPRKNTLQISATAPVQG